MAISSELNAGGTVERRSGRHGMAFLIEALVVLAFLMLALAVFAQLFSAAQLEGKRAKRLSEAVLVASNYAEEFSARPLGVRASSEENGYLVSCSIKPVAYDGGTLYNATITVSDDAGEIYTLTTSRYQSSKAGGETA